jgi:hypothetical protein
MSVAIDFGVDEFLERLQKSARGLRTYQLVGTTDYLVRSRSEGGYHVVTTKNGRIEFCDCKGFHWRRVCTHYMAVSKRLRRERRHNGRI